MASGKDKSKAALRKMNDAWERFRRLVHADLPGNAVTMDVYTNMAKQKRRYR